MMKIQINYGDIEHSDSLTGETEQRINSSLEPFTDRITRVEVHLRDDKQKRRGPDDKRCTMEIRLAGDQPFVVETKSHDIYDAMREATDKARRAVKKRLDRRKEE